jgi:hypothetical protein
MFILTLRSGSTKSRVNVSAHEAFSLIFFADNGGRNLLPIKRLFFTSRYSCEQLLDPIIYTIGFVCLPIHHLSMRKPHTHTNYWSLTHILRLIRLAAPLAAVFFLKEKTIVACRALKSMRYWLGHVRGEGGNVTYVCFVSVCACVRLSI